MLTDYKAELSKRDSKLGEIIKNIEITRVKPDTTLFESLIKSVVHQQLSGKAAGTIYNRFKEACGGNLSPGMVLNTNTEVLRNAGLSASKCLYVHNIAAFAINHGLEEETLEGMPDEELITYLTGIKGVGRWTSEMLLMFHLRREDVLPLDDLVIRQRMKQLYRIAEEKKKIENIRMMEIAEIWRPYRSIACLYLWKSDNTLYL
jgi:DNA-3-methyladenine glycosylase II